MGSQKTLYTRDKNQKKKCKKDMTTKFLDTEKHLHSEFLRLKKGRV